MDNANLELIDDALVRRGGAPSRTRSEWARFTMPASRLHQLLHHVRRTHTLPDQACTRFGTFIDKKKGINGFFGLRLLHNFCPFWRIFPRKLLRDDGGSTTTLRGPTAACRSAVVNT